MGGAYSEGQLQVLAAPDVHARIVSTQVLEVLAVDCEQTASHRRRPAERKKQMRHLSGVHCIDTEAHA